MIPCLSFIGDMADVFIAMNMIAMYTSGGFIEGHVWIVPSVENPLDEVKRYLAMERGWQLLQMFECIVVGRRRKNEGET